MSAYGYDDAGPASPCVRAMPFSSEQRNTTTSRRTLLIVMPSRVSF